MGHRRFPDGAPTEDDWIAMPTRRITTSESPIARASGEHAAPPASAMLATHMARGGHPSRSAEQPVVAREAGEVWVQRLRVLLVVTALVAAAVLLWRWLAP